MPTRKQHLYNSIIMKLYMKNNNSRSSSLNLAANNRVKIIIYNTKVYMYIIYKKYLNIHIYIIRYNIYYGIHIQRGAVIHLWSLQFKAR